MAGVSALLLAASLGQLAAKSRPAPGYDQAFRVADEMRQIVPKDSIFLGNDILYVKLWDYPHFVALDDVGLAQLQLHLGEAALWEKIGPNAIALAHQHPVPIPQSLVNYIITHNFFRVRCWDTAQLGRIELFMQSLPPGITPTPECMAPPAE
jgi:hypothetical protein